MRGIIVVLEEVVNTPINDLDQARDSRLHKPRPKTFSIVAGYNVVLIHLLAQPFLVSVLWFGCIRDTFGETRQSSLPALFNHRIELLDPHLYTTSNFIFVSFLCTDNGVRVNP